MLLREVEENSPDSKIEIGAPSGPSWSTRGRHLVVGADAQKLGGELLSRPDVDGITL